MIKDLILKETYGYSKKPDGKTFIRRMNDLIKIELDCTQQLLDYMEGIILAKEETTSASEKVRLETLYQEAREGLEALQESQLRLANLPRGEVSSM